MSQKKPPTPPFEQHSSSSDDEEDVSAEEEATPFQQQTRADSSSDDEEEVSVEEEVESEEEEHGSDEEVTPVKPAVFQSPKVRAKSTQKKQPDLAPPASAVTVTVGKKRPGDSKAIGNVTKKLKKKLEDKRVSEDVVKSKSKLIQRVFSVKDEIAMLNALFDYSSNKCIDPIEDITDFHNFVKKSIHFDVTRSQLSSKIKKMKSKYKKNASKSKETFGKAHDQSCYDISKKIWGKSCGGSELKTTRKGKRIPKTNMTPGLQIPQVVEEPVRENISLSELAKTRDVVGMMCLSDDTFKKGLELLSDDEARAALEYKWVTAELELNYKRLELSRELMKSYALGHRG